MSRVRLLCSLCLGLLVLGVLKVVRTIPGGAKVAEVGFYSPWIARSRRGPNVGVPLADSAAT